MAAIASALHTTSALHPSAATPGAGASSSSGGTSASGGSSSSDSTVANDALANEQTFLQLLVSQLKNQDPSAPMDGTQFVTQLAQFSQLEQDLAMRQDLDKIAGSITTTPVGGTTGTGNSGSGGGSSAAAIGSDANSVTRPAQ